VIGALFAAWGLVQAPRPGARAFVLAFLAVTMAVHVATLVAWRYRTPYWGPIALLYGVFGIFGLFDTLARRWAPPS